MRDRLKQEAEMNGRSMNAEIIARLEASLAPAKRGLLNSLKRSVSEFEEDQIASLRREMKELETLIRRFKGYESFEIAPKKKR